MTETERITHAVYDRRLHSPLHRCHTAGCPNIVAGDDHCARCAEEINGQPYTFAAVLSEFPEWTRVLFWTVAVSVPVVFAVSILFILF